VLVGFAGLGRMGRPVARHLPGAGHKVVAYDPAVPPDAVPDDLRAAGVEFAREHDVVLPVAITVGRDLDAARDAGLADRDMAEVLYQLRSHQEDR
jgi:nucleoside-diphosphate-sugar epimerase